MTKAKAKARAKARALAKLRQPREKGEKADETDNPKMRAEQHGPDKSANRPFGGQQNIKSARTSRGAARSR